MLSRRHQPILLTVVTPAYNEAVNLPLLYERLVTVFNSLKVDWEWIVVDDHSADDTFDVVSHIAKSNPKVQCLRLSRNSGAHSAIMCGLEYATGHCTVILASDLQDPPEIIPSLLEKWLAGAQVIWAARSNREGETRLSLGFARFYYFLMRRVVGIKDMPSTGADFLMIDQRVVAAVQQFKETNTNLFALITWIGFRQAIIFYDKAARVHGKSGWSLERKLKLILDSLASFTYLPIRLMSYIGFTVALLGFLYAGIVVMNGLAGRPPEGWASIMVVILIIGGIQMLMLGILGEYIWRALDETRHRPRYIIEERTPMPLDTGTEELDIQSETTQL